MNTNSCHLLRTTILLMGAAVFLTSAAYAQQAGDVGQDVGCAKFTTREPSEGAEIGTASLTCRGPIYKHIGQGGLSLTRPGLMVA